MLAELSDTAAAGLVAVGFAPCAGSFLGVVVDRLPRGAPIAVARSACPCCGATLGPRDLVPLLSYAMSRGKCRHCGQRISPFHPAIELAATLVAVIVAVMADSPLDVMAGCGLGWALLTLAWIDYDHYYLPDVIVLPLLLAGLGIAWWRDGELPVDGALGAVIGYSALALLAWGYRRLRGHDGLGLGDAKLLAAGGAWLGWEALSPVILLAAGGGLAVAGVLRLMGRPITRMTRLPFGPFLAAAIWIIYLAQTALFLF